MTRLAIEQVSGDELRGNVWLRTELSLLAAPSYDDAAAILARSVTACTHLYLGRDACGQLTAFLMTRREVSAGDESLLLVHLGWGVCRADLKNSGAMVALFERWIVLIRDRERRQRFLPFEESFRTAPPPPPASTSAPPACGPGHASRRWPLRVPGSERTSGRCSCRAWPAAARGPALAALH